MEQHLVKDAWLAEKGRDAQTGAKHLMKRRGRHGKNGEEIHGHQSAEPDHDISTSTGEKSCCSRLFNRPAVRTEPTIAFVPVRPEPTEPLPGEHQRCERSALCCLPVPGSRFKKLADRNPSGLLARIGLFRGLPVGQTPPTRMGFVRFETASLVCCAVLGWQERANAARKRCPVSFGRLAWGTRPWCR